MAVRTRNKILILGGALTMRNIAAVQARISEALRRRSSVEIDCSAATEIDLSFVQLLLAARKSAVRLGKSLTLAAPPSDLLRDVLARAGLLSTAGGDEAEFWAKGAIPA